MEKKIKAKFVLPLISVLALLPCYFSFVGIQGFINNPDSPGKQEYLYLVGLSVVQCALLFLVFLFFVYFLRKQVNFKLLSCCLAPFLFSAASGVFAHLNGIPW